MIYKLQRLYSKGDNKQEAQKSEQPPKQSTKYVEYGSAKEAEEGSKKLLQERNKKLAGNTSFIDENGNRITREVADKEFETQMKNVEALKQSEREAAKKLKQEARKAKFNKAKNQAEKWAKKNKKGLIIGGSVVGVGTGAAIVGSKIHKKNQQNKIKEEVRGYSDAED